MADYEDKKGVKDKDLTVSRVMADFKAAAEVKSKLTKREIEDFKYALGEQWSDEDKVT
ncbi:MAG: hypothetical protein IPN19_12790 [Elusimicrobia bacterium]|nr:hypothetical protein [Elusimicrobiota bacterium]